MLRIYIGSAILVLCFNVVHCGYCDQYTIPFRGFVKNVTRFYLNGESFTVVCESGYRVVVENAKFTCRNGVWNGHFPPCIASDCSEPPPPVQHSKIKFYTGKHLSSAEYTCDEHYIPTHDFKVECSFGSWISRHAICQDSRCYTHNLNSAAKELRAVSLAKINYTSSGERLNVECSDGYHLAGMKPLCVRGSWSGFEESPCRENNCTVDTVSKGALFESREKKVWRWNSLKRERTEVLKKVNIGRQRIPGAVLYVACDQYYAFQVQGKRDNSTTCTKGKWFPEPICTWA